MASLRGRGGHRGATAVAILVGFLAMAAVMGFGLATSAGPGAGGRGAPAPGSSRATPSAPATPTPTPLGRSKPVRMHIPAMGVDRKVARLGLAKGGKMLKLPKKPKRPGWFDRSVTPGEMGPMIVIGYIDAGIRGRGVFERLHKLGKGDQITMTRKDGVVATYRVDRIKSYPPAKLPVRKVYGASRSPVLRIITCGGSLTKGARPTNVVVYASLVGIRR
jgi:hypothetical protein